ncbi:hypothetical protein TanjilG_27556 [Lupinus angustifolius]|uniref:Uncharacterized protein n=1 Tax=Lupinus angustifolius TaxID=3871 RepID=A0A4P1R344_LUPAN|nr:PREDICTED: uncharacterized protein LOC109361924 [Lupinus angustifolius]OIW00305.1 hypothetical protein TanjilG_27556 [Lupinus angustifolius]
MNKIITIISFLAALTASYSVYALHNHKAEGEGFFYVAPALPLFEVAVTVVVAIVLILAFRATVMTWITVLVLLAFAGNRRKVLVQRGRRITLDVTWYLVSVMFRSQKGLLALACATLLSFLATYR